jgi:hypothetical protein
MAASSRVGHETSGLDVVTEGHVAAHPEAPSTRGGDLVADTLAGDLALELREREQHVEREPTHGRGRVELLSDRDEGDVMRVEGLDDPGEVGERVSRSTL